MQGLTTATLLAEGGSVIFDTSHFPLFRENACPCPSPVFASATRSQSDVEVRLEARACCVAMEDSSRKAAQPVQASGGATKGLRSARRPASGVKHSGSDDADLGAGASVVGASVWHGVTKHGCEIGARNRATPTELAALHEFVAANRDEHGIVRWSRVFDDEARWRPVLGNHMTVRGGKQLFKIWDRLHKIRKSTGLPKCTCGEPPYTGRRAQFKPAAPVEEEEEEEELLDDSGGTSQQGDKSARLASYEYGGGAPGLYQAMGLMPASFMGFPQQNVAQQPASNSMVAYLNAEAQLAQTGQWQVMQAMQHQFLHGYLATMATAQAMQQQQQQQFQQASPPDALTTPAAQLVSLPEMALAPLQGGTQGRGKGQQGPKGLCRGLYMLSALLLGDEDEV